MSEETKRKIKVYGIAIAIPSAVGLLSAWLTRGNMRVYSELQAPPLSPPSVLFPIVWTLLYVLMGISSAMVWSAREKNPAAADTGLGDYAASLAFNFAWSIIFFNFRRFLFAFGWLLVLLYLILRTIGAYRKVSPTAAYLQIPYSLWVSFAGYLNFGIWYLNR